MSIQEGAMRDTIEIKDESYQLKGRLAPKFVLYVDGDQVATVSSMGTAVQLTWQIYGPQYWPDAKDLLRGLMELACVADQLSAKLTPKYKEE